jgi:hypothetical protein
VGLSEFAVVLTMTASLMVMLTIILSPILSVSVLIVFESSIALMITLSMVASVVSSVYFFEVEAVIVNTTANSDKPTYKIMVGNSERDAIYVSGSNTRTLKFAYTIVADEIDNANGVTAKVNKFL